MEDLMAYSLLLPNQRLWLLGVGCQGLAQTLTSLGDYQTLLS